MSYFNINRRNFLKSSMASFALTSLGANGLDIIYRKNALKVGLIGCGWYGKSDVCRLIQVAPVKVVAICDVDKQMLTEASELIKQRQKSGKSPKQFTDFRKMIASEEMDLIIIATPDHWHALQAIEAMKGGSHLYLQKPISLDVREGEAIVAAAGQYNRVVQVGLQRRSTHHLMNAKENIIDNGRIGKVSHVEMCCYYHMRMNEYPHVKDIPASFDYDMWAGPAPKVPFRGMPHKQWRSYMEYSNGIVGDMCVHMYDTVRWMLGLDWPKKISSTGGIYVQKNSVANTSDTQHVVFEHDEINCVWQHRSWGNSVDPDYPWAFFIHGEKGTLKGSVNKFEFIPISKSQKHLREPVKLEKEEFPEDFDEKGIELHVAPATRNHMLDLLNAIETGRKPRADILNGHISTASCIMANISMNLGKPLIYDQFEKIIKNDEEATSMLKRKYREPWEHPSNGTL